MSTSELAAVYDLPVPVWITYDAFGTRSATGLSGLPFEVRLPRRTVVERVDVISPPTLPGVSDDDEKLCSRPWAMNYAAEPTAPSMALCRVALVCEITDENAARSRFNDGAAAAFRVGDALAQLIQSWFDEVRSWVEVATGQDLDFKHPLADAEDPAEGLLLAHNGELKSSGQMRLTTRRVRPVTLREWTQVLAHVEAGRKPPTEHLLIRNAHAALARNSPRRAVLDAATATEIVLNQVLERTVELMPDGPREAFLKEQRMLGRLMTFLKNSGVELEQSWTALQSVATLRNASIHKGSEPSHMDAAIAVSTATKLVNQYGTLGTDR